jgi:hypothetical protein
VMSLKARANVVIRNELGVSIQKMSFSNRPKMASREPECAGRDLNSGCDHGKVT